MIGALIYTGASAKKPKIELIDFTKADLKERTLRNVEESFPFRDSVSVSWLNIRGLGDPSIIKKIGDHYGIHPLVQEDILSTNQRPKIEIFDDYVYIVLKMLDYDERGLDVEQVSIILGQRFVISFQEKDGDVFEQVRTRIRNGRGNIRKGGNDYLTYALIDAIVDNYFVVLERIGDRISEIEEKLLEPPTPQIVHTIQELKRELLVLRRSVWPLREVLTRFNSNESKLIKKQTEVFVRDVYDHTIEVIDTVEIFRDVVSGMFEIYLSSLSNRMNQIMKVLTVISTIFIPLTFLAGVYGTNFRNLPELEWTYGYFIMWGVMVVIALGMLFYFKRKKWI
jgi:magnesium transporter